LSSVLCKLFESVLLKLFQSDLQSDTLQFGLKKNSECVHALFTFRESIQYFTSKGSRVFCVSLDASKAFDRGLHSGLFRKLLQKGISAMLVKLLSYWYSHQVCAVLRNSVLGRGSVCISLSLLRVGNAVLQWTDKCTNKLKYLGAFFCSNSCRVDVRKFYGSLIMFYQY